MNNPDPWRDRNDGSGGDGGSGGRGGGSAMAGHLRFLLLIVGVVAVAAGTVWVVSLFTDKIDFSSDGPWLVFLVSWGLVLASGFLLGERIGLGEAVRSILIWLALGFVLVVGYSYRDEFKGLWDRVSGELAPGTVTTEGRSMSVRAGAGNHFYIDVKFNDATETLLIDTGATSTVISQSLARRAGLDPKSLSYTVTLSTANGQIKAAPVRISRVTIGPREFVNVRVLVSGREGGRTSVLGIETLRLFKSYGVEGNTFTLRW